MTTPAPDAGAPLLVAARRYRIVARVERPLALPDYAGSALRGVFGHALRDIACITGRPECTGCPRLRDCAYPYLFETPVPENTRRAYSAVPHPYVIEPPETGASGRPDDSLTFGMVLIGRAMKHHDLVRAAWSRALLRGLGPAQGTARLTGFELQDEISASPSPDMVSDRPVASAERPDDTTRDTVRMTFTTPLRLKRDGKVLRADQIEAADILFGLVRRQADLDEFHGPSDAGVNRPHRNFSAYRQAAQRVVGLMQLRTFHWARHSSRQQRSMQLDGATGAVTLHGDLSMFSEALYRGQWLHVGGKATFGLGRYFLGKS